MNILDIFKSGNTVLTFKDIFLSFGETNPALLRRKLSYYVKKNYLYPLRRGIYAKNKNYNKYELATRICTPSYISFETVLSDCSVNFQYYTQIFVASYKTKEIECDGQKYVYSKMRDDILTNPSGVRNQDGYSIASVERAFLDIIYSHKNYHFDNLSPLNWDKVYELLPIYGGNKRMAKTVKLHHEGFKNGLT
jgi:predicted transcriptional regulator of viral defense system